MWNYTTTQLGVTKLSIVLEIHGLHTLDTSQGISCPFLFDHQSVGGMRYSLRVLFPPKKTDWSKMCL
jgi:hypothetical protein